MKTSVFKRLSALLLAAMLLFSMLPLAFAQDMGGEQPQTGEGQEIIPLSEGEGGELSQPEHVHTPGEAVSTATCTTDGAKTVSCTVCGEVLSTETIPAGHSYAENVTKAANCTEAGVKTFACSACGDSYTEDIPAAGHSYAESITTPATCAAAGEKTFTCSACGNTYNEPIPAAHTPGEAVVVNATCTVAGSKTISCSIEGCGEVLSTEVIPAGHSYTENVTKEATCTAAGQKTLTCACGDSQTVELPANGHTYVEGVCSVCGEAEPVKCSYRPDCAAAEHEASCIKGNVDKATVLFDALLNELALSDTITDELRNSANSQMHNIYQLDVAHRTAWSGNADFAQYQMAVWNVVAEKLGLLVSELPAVETITAENLDAVKAKYAKLKLLDDINRQTWQGNAREMDIYNVLNADGKYEKIAQVIANSVMMLNTVPAVAKIGETGYTTLNEALVDANKMTGNVTITILGKVEYSDSSPSLTGAYDKISFVGESEDAEISITRNGSNGYISGEVNDCAVTFTGLKLSKPYGGYANDAGNMNVAFTVYRVGSVSYTNCTFPNGACAAGCPTSYTGCTFQKSHDKYPLWAYGADVTVERCTFDDDRGIKMYAEGAAKTTALTVNNSNFSKLTGKPAIVLTYGEGVTLSNNTYSDTGVFELDLDGAPNGTPVSSDVPVTCKNDNGACGVMVGGKIYTTVAQAADAAKSGDTVTLLHNSTETVELPAGVSLDKNGFTADNVSAVSPVAQVGETKYTSLQEAINNANGGTVKLLDSVSLDEGVTIPVGSVVTLELNGKTISRNTEVAATSAAITNNGTLTVQDSLGGGKITAFAANPDTADIPYYANNTITNCGVFTLISGTIENSTGDNARAAYPIDNNSTVRDAIVYIQGGTVTGRGAIRQFANSTTNKNEVYITGGTVSGTSYGIWAQNPASGDPVAKLSISENANVAKVLLSPSANFDISISGGTVSDVAIWSADTTNPARNPSGFITGGTFTNGSIDTSFLAKGYTLESNGSGYSPVLTDPEAKIGETPYATLAEAIAEANAKGGTVVLQKDVKLDAPLNVTGTVILDLNGKTVSQEKECTGHYGMINNSGSLTIMDSSGGNGKISFKDTGTGDSAFGWGSYTIVNTGNLVVESGTIENLSQQNSASVSHMYCAIQQSRGTTTINGGSIVNNTYRSVRVNSGHLLINGGNFTGQVWLQPNQGDASIEVNNGTFAPSGADGSSIYLTNEGEGYGVSSAAIKGGTFNTKIGAASPAALGGIITGGNFAEAAKNDTNTALLATGYTFTPNTDGTYSPVSSNEASINGTLYDTLASAVSAAADGNTIRLLKDASLSGELAISNSITIDPNGFTLDVSGVTKITVATGKVLTINLDFATYGETYKTLAPGLCVTEGSIKIQNHIQGTAATCTSGAICATCRQPMSDPIPHSYTYTGSGNTITETCANGCNHSATAKLERDSAVSTVYTGKEIKALKVVYSDNWKAAKDLTITYSDNVNIGKNAKGTITKTFGTNQSATATATFEITRVAYTMTPNNLRYVRGSGYPLSFTTNVPYTAANTLNSLTIFRANGTLVMNVPIDPNYVVLSSSPNGMTVITLSAAVMNSLEALNYELLAEFAYGTAKTPFRVLLPFIFPMTGDEANAALLLVVSLAALGGAAAIVITMKKKQSGYKSRH